MLIGPGPIEQSREGPPILTLRAGTIDLLPVSPVSASVPSGNNLAWPKSATRARESQYSSTLLGFRSRCTTLSVCSCRYRKHGATKFLSRGYTVRTEYRGYKYLLFYISKLRTIQRTSAPNSPLVSVPISAAMLTLSTIGGGATPTTAPSRSNSPITFPIWKMGNIRSREELDSERRENGDEEDRLVWRGIQSLRLLHKTGTYALLFKKRQHPAS